MCRQKIENQQGEIFFRRKLYLHQVSESSYLPDELDRNGIEAVLQARMEKTRRQMKALLDRGTVLTPYLEIGAERCQRALVLQNDLSAQGIAADISFDMLRSCEYYRGRFQKRKVPLRVCCDAYNLPLLSDSIALCFCYQTLHHFPDPTPILEEVYRVLRPGGVFFFDEEPYKCQLHVGLYKMNKMYSKTALSRSRLRKVIDRFCGKRICNEVAYGIVENDKISVATWKRALSLFSRRDVELSVGGRLRSPLFEPRRLPLHGLTQLLGGNISGVCQKEGTFVQRGMALSSLLACPSCREQKKDNRLLRKSAGLSCLTCGAEYLWHDGVLFLLSARQLGQLYPDIHARSIR